MFCAALGRKREESDARLGVKQGTRVARRRQRDLGKLHGRGLRDDRAVREQGPAAYAKSLPRRDHQEKARDQGKFRRHPDGVKGGTNSIGGRGKRATDGTVSISCRHH